MLTTIRTAPALCLRAGQLEVKLATTLAELDAAMRLRFEVFNLELQEGLQASYERGYDRDAYDAYCDHLIVKDAERDEVVGTYRLLRDSQAAHNIGFYSENEFDLRNLKRLPGQLLELGRSCIRPSHRSFATINLLWSAIAQYARANQINYLFGCASLHVAEAAAVQPLYAYLRQRHFAPEQYRVYPTPACRMPISDEASTTIDEPGVARRLSPILKGYLRTGAVICGPPAYDAEFGTADVLVLLEMERLAGRYRQHYVAEAQN